MQRGERGEEREGERENNINDHCSTEVLSSYNGDDFLLLMLLLLCSDVGLCTVTTV